MFYTVLPLLHDERYDRGKFERQSQGEDEGAQKTRDSVVYHYLVVGKRQGVVGNSYRDTLTKLRVDNGLGS